MFRFATIVMTVFIVCVSSGFAQSGGGSRLSAATKSATTAKKETPKVEVEIENEIKQNPKIIELTNEIKKLSDQVETLSRKIKSLEELIKTTYIKEKPRTIQNTRPVVTRR